MSEAVTNHLIQMLTNRSRSIALVEGSCVWCGGEANEFRTREAKKQYGFNAMCQRCQDQAEEDIKELEEFNA